MLSGLQFLIMKKLAIVFACLLLSWFCYTGLSYGLHRLRMRSIATELGHEQRIFYIVGEPLIPSTALPGEERHFVLGISDGNQLLGSIVRNSKVSDSRGNWKFDQCYRPDLGSPSGRCPIWESYDHWPTEQEIAAFRKLSLQQPWVLWDTPRGTDPELTDNLDVAPE